MKKTFTLAALFMAFLLFLTSCAKSVSKEEAVNFAKENYDYSSVEYTKCTENIVSVVNKSEGIFKIALEVGTTEETNEVSPSLKTFDTFMLTVNESATYAIDGNKIIVTIVFTPEQFLKEGELDVEMPEGASVSGNGFKATYSFNANGYLEEVTTSIDVSLEASALGFSVSGALSSSSVTSYEYSE